MMTAAMTAITAQKKAVTVIPATIARFTFAPINETGKRRVAGYARVSTDSDEQQSSYEAQVDYYTNYISSHEDWDFVGIYTDDGISATNTKKRDGFNRMVADALDGKIELIVTKSVSRFARNTVDSLVTVRMLKEKGIEIYFEKENIWTLDAKGELLITIMSSLAQEESRSISENVTWGKRKRFSDGKVSVAYSNFLGYDKGDIDGVLKINEQEAVLVRRIYRMFLDGMTPYGIAKKLTDEGIPSPSGKDKWNSKSISSILTNEKYKGDALLQKHYTVDYLSKKQKVNKGEVQQYYVENAHPAIIEPSVYELVQREIRNRSSDDNNHSGIDIFASKIKCGACGEWFGPKVWHSTSKYRRTVYQCNGKYKDGEKCQTPHLDGGAVKRLFIEAANRFLLRKKEVIANMKAVKWQLFDTSGLEDEAARLQSEADILAEMIQKAVKKNAQETLDQGDYQQRYSALAERHVIAKEQLDGVLTQISEKKSQSAATDVFIKELSRQKGLIAEFDEQLWHNLLDFVTVYADDDIRFTFRNGVVVKV